MLTVLAVCVEMHYIRLPVCPQSGQRPEVIGAFLAPTVLAGTSTLPHMLPHCQRSVKQHVTDAIVGIFVLDLPVCCYGFPTWEIEPAWFAEEVLCRCRGFMGPICGFAFEVFIANIVV